MDDDTSTTWEVNYESKTYSVDTKSSGSFSITIQGIERTLFRSPSGREFLTRQGLLEGEKEPTELVSKIPSMFLAGEETCNQYVASVLSTTTIESSIQHRIVSSISKDAIDISSVLEGKEEGFFIKADVEIVKETSFNGFVNLMDYDSEGRRMPIEKDCTICLEEIANGKSKITKLGCYHHFHRDCILSWLRRKLSCPTCRNEIHKRPAHTQLKPGEVRCFKFKGARVTLT